MSRTPMKLILTQEVTGLGAPGDVVEVAGGYGRNYLVPRGLAMRWTRGAEKQIDLIKRARAARDIRGLDDARDTANALAALTVRLQTRAGASGRLFGSFGAAALSSFARPSVARRPSTVEQMIGTIGWPAHDRDGFPPLRMAGRARPPARPLPPARPANPPWGARPREPALGNAPGEPAPG